MERVLVVDDDPSTAKAMAMLLRQDGYEVEAFTSGREAVATLRSGRAFDAVVTDLQMPSVDGMAVARAARGSSPGACIVITHRGRADLQELLRAGACAAMEKPIHYDGMRGVLEDCRAQRGEIGPRCPGCRRIGGIHL